MIEVKLDELYTKDGRLNSAVIRQSWFKQSQLYTNIMTATNWMEERTKLSQRIYHWIHSTNIIPNCVICGQLCLFNPYASKYGSYNTTCAQKRCIAINNVEKRQTTMLTKYGALTSPALREAARSRAVNLKEKGNITKIAKYGSTSIRDIPGAIEKRNATIVSKYGTAPWSLHHAAILETSDVSKCEQMSAHSCSVTNVTRDPQRLCTIRTITFDCGECKQTGILPYETFKWRSKRNNPCNCSAPAGSYLEQDVSDFIASYYNGPIHYCNRSTIPPYEIDILLPALNIGIEVNGAYWHGDNQQRIDKYYHKNKTDIANSKGISLVHIFEQDWMNPTTKAIIKSRLLNMLGLSSERIFARQTSLATISASQGRAFLQDNHIQGADRSSFYCGLFYKDELVAVMSCSMPRFNKNVEWELVRFASKKHTNVVGGCNKLFKYFIRECSPESVISYADRCWSEGNIYGKLGFAHDGITSPGYVYILPSTFEVLSRFQTQKHKLHKLLSNYDATLTEYENMRAHNYVRVWDCGNVRWMWTTKKY